MTVRAKAGAPSARDCEQLRRISLLNLFLRDHQKLTLQCHEIEPVYHLPLPHILVTAFSRPPQEGPWKKEKGVK